MPVSLSLSIADCPLCVWSAVELPPFENRWPIYTSDFTSICLTPNNRQRNVITFACSAFFANHYKETCFTPRCFAASWRYIYRWPLVTVSAAFHDLSSRLLPFNFSISLLNTTISFSPTIFRFSSFIFFIQTIVFFLCSIQKYLFVLLYFERFLPGIYPDLIQGIFFITFLLIWTL